MPYIHASRGNWHDHPLRRCHGPFNVPVTRVSWVVSRKDGVNQGPVHLTRIEPLDRMGSIQTSLDSPEETATLSTIHSTSEAAATFGLCLPPGVAACTLPTNGPHWRSRGSSIGHLRYDLAHRVTPAIVTFLSHLSEYSHGGRPCIYHPGHICGSCSLGKGVWSLRCSSTCHLTVDVKYLSLTRTNPAHLLQFRQATSWHWWLILISITDSTPISSVTVIIFSSIWQGLDSNL